MTRESILARGRAANEAIRFVDVATIFRPGVPVFDPDTGSMAPTSTIVHAGPCMIKMPTAVETERTFGEEQVTATRYIACFPWDTFGVQVDDEIVVSESEDVDLLDVTLKIVSVPVRTDVLYKGFGCEVVA